MGERVAPQAFGRAVAVSLDSGWDARILQIQDTSVLSGLLPRVYVPEDEFELGEEEGLRDLGQEPVGQSHRF